MAATVPLGIAEVCHCQAHSGALVSVALRQGREQQSSPAILVAHATGLCKEAYEPLEDHLAALTSVAGAVSFDFQGHGGSELLPAVRAAAAADPDVVWEQGADDVSAVASCDAARRVLSLGAGVVGIGHSYGAASLLNAVALQRTIPGVRGLVLYEPILRPDKHQRPRGVKNPLAAAARRRRPTFDSFEAALANFSAKPPTGSWDTRVLRGYVQGGFCIDSQSGSAKICCEPLYEALMYSGQNRILQLCSAQSPPCPCPVLLLVGETSRTLDMDGATNLEVYQEVALTLGAQLRVVPGLGHFGPLERPAVVAALAAEFIASLPMPSRDAARL